MIYLDFNASAPVSALVAAQVASAIAQGGNPSSVHAAGRTARGRVEVAREALATAVGCAARDLVFTSGGTEANALAIQGLPLPRVLASAVEHDCVLALADATIPVDGQGRVDPEALEAALKDGPALVCIMAANNETGVIQPLRELAPLVRAAGSLLHVDAVQALAKLPVEVAHADTMAFSAHKLGGPQGVGALYVRPGLTVAARQRGGGQELGRRAGTENVGGIVGFGAALRERAEDAEWTARVTALRDSLETALLEAGAQIIARDVPRLCNTIAVRMPGVAAATQVMALDLAGFAVSAGSACSSGKVKPSHVLRAMGCPDAVAGETIRVSLGWTTTEEEIASFVKAWRATRARLVPSRF